MTAVTLRVPVHFFSPVNGLIHTVRRAIETAVLILRYLANTPEEGKSRETNPSVVRTAVRSAMAGPVSNWPEDAFPLPPGMDDDDVSGRVLPCGGARPSMASRAHIGT